MSEELRPQPADPTVPDVDPRVSVPLTNPYFSARSLIPPPPPKESIPFRQRWLWTLCLLLLFVGVGEGGYLAYLSHLPPVTKTIFVTKLVTPTPTAVPQYTAQDVYNAFLSNQVSVNSHADMPLITTYWRQVGFPAQSTSGMLLNDASVGFSGSWPLGMYVFAKASDVQQDVQAILQSNAPTPNMNGPYYFYAHHLCLLIGDQRMTLITLAPYELVMNTICV